MDADVTAALLSALENGSTYKMAAISAGLSERSIYRWLKEGENAPVGSTASEFCHALKRANAKSAHNALQKIQEGRRGWKASAWFLERRFPEHYSSRRQSGFEGALLT